LKGEIRGQAKEHPDPPLVRLQTSEIKKDSLRGSPLSHVGGSGKQPTIHTLCSHPHLPYYLSGGIDGAITLWQFKFPASVANYRPAATSRIHRIKFSNTGTKFGACDHSGKVSLWRWSSQEESINPYRTLQCHTGRCTDMAFLNLGSFFATAGHSSDKSDTVCFWDSLLPDSKANVWNCLALEGGASTLCYSPRHQVLFVGGKKGSISAVDLRQHQVMFTIDKLHEMNCRTLSCDASYRYLISGSTDGCIKVWDINKTMEYNESGPLPQLFSWDDVHKQQTFVRPLSPGMVSTYGVTEVRVTEGGCYSCGADGRLLFRPIT